jgi:hypothetical protein
MVTCGGQFAEYEDSALGTPSIVLGFVTGCRCQVVDNCLHSSEFMLLDTLHFVDNELHMGRITSGYKARAINLLNETMTSDLDANLLLNRHGEDAPFGRPSRRRDEAGFALAPGDVLDLVERHMQRGADPGRELGERRHDRSP